MQNSSPFDKSRLHGGAGFQIFNYPLVDYWQLVVIIDSYLITLSFLSACEMLDMHAYS